jgi:hypothetical protein
VYPATGRLVAVPEADDVRSPKFQPRRSFRPYKVHLSQLTHRRRLRVSDLAAPSYPTAWRAISLIALFLAAGALAVAVIAVTKKTPSPQKVSLAPVAAVSSEEAALKTEVGTLHALVAAADAKLQKLDGCLPELDSIIGSMSVETGTLTVGEKTLLTNAYLKTGKSASSYCQSTLEAAP